MPVIIEDRPTNTVREEVIDQLIMNYSHGELSFEAFERRLDAAMASECNKELIRLTADLDLVVDKQYAESKKLDLGAKYVPGEAQESEQIVNIFSGSDREGAWKVAKEIRYYSVFSGSNIDFSQALFTHPEVRIKIFSLLSGDNIYVPENINVISKAFSIFGGIDINMPSNADRNAPTIVIEGYCIFSGINIEVKRTIKEKFVAFADSLKKMFS